MSFLYPSFLFALISLSIPVIIHLFNFRRYKKVSFTNVAMLREIEVSTKSVRQLKNLLVLMCRLLGLAFLIFAFAQPFLPVNSEDKNTAEALIIYVDNSFSMGQSTGNDHLLDNAKSIAVNVLSEESKGERPIFIMSGKFSQSEMNPLDNSEALEVVDRIDFSSFSRSVEEIINRTLAIKSKLNKKEVSLFIISDFQRNQFEGLKLEEDSGITISLVPLQQEETINISIDSCWLHNPGLSLSLQDSLTIIISNHGTQSIEKQPLRLYINGNQTQLSNVSLPSNSTSEVTIPIEFSGFGSFECEVQLEGDEIDFDNRYYFNIDRDSVRNVYGLGDKRSFKYLNAIFQPPLNFKYDSEKNIDMAFLKSSNTLIIQSPINLSPGHMTEIQNLVMQGSKLIIIPSDTHNLNPLLTTLNLELLGEKKTEDQWISEVNLSSTLIEQSIEDFPNNADLPMAHSYFNLNEKSRVAKEDIFSFKNGNVGLRNYSVGKGSVYLFTFGITPNQSNFAKHSLVVPVFLSIAYSSENFSQISYEINERVNIELPVNESTDEIYHFTGDQTEIIPEIVNVNGVSNVRIGSEVQSPGFYKLNQESKVLKTVSLNYSRNESDFSFLNSEEIIQLSELMGEQQTSIYSGSLQGISEQITASSKPIRLWKYCLILALLFFISEVLVIKFIKS